MADDPLPGRRSDGAFDPLADGGELELVRRVDAAPVERIPRADLDGHVGLSSRELWELGTTLRPVGLRGAPAAVAGRLQLLLGLLLVCLGVAAILSDVLEPLLRGVDDVFRDPERPDTAVEFTLALFLAMAVGGTAMARRGVARVRRGVSARRRAVSDVPVDAARDPRARPTVALVPTAGGWEASLLWLRGAPDDPSLVEARTLLRERIEADDLGGAEDAVERLSEVALRAEAAHGIGSSTGGDGIPRPGALPGPSAGSATDDRRTGAELAAGVGRALPAVDPRDPVADGWDPEPLTDRGRAEIAARLVRAAPVPWNPAVLERVAVPPDRPSRRVVPPWPAGSVRGRPRAEPLRRSVRRAVAVGVGIAGLVALGALGQIDEVADPTVPRVVAWSAIAVAAALLGGRRLARRLAPGERLLRLVRDAGRAPGRALERGLPGPAGRVLVLRGRRGSVDRFELVHVRAVPEEDDDRLEVRTLAWREVDTADDARREDTAVQLWRVADDAGFVVQRRSRDAGVLRRLNRGLGRAVERRRALGLRREPVAWLAGAFGVAVVVALARFPLGLRDDLLERGLTNRVLSFAWPTLFVVLAFRAARRLRDPYDD